MRQTSYFGDDWLRTKCCPRFWQ